MSVPLYPPSLGEQPARQLNALEEAFDSLRLDVPQVDGELFEDPAAIVEQVLSNRLLNATTTIETERSAFNTSSWAEFIVRVPTPLTDEISVYHYSKSVRLDSLDQIIAL